MRRAWPRYLAVFRTFARNSLVRDMMFKTNFLIQCVGSVLWMGVTLCFYVLIFNYADEIGKGTGWHKYEYFVFLSTAMLVNSLMQAFVMPNAQEFSEMIRTGNLDFALLKPIDTQFLVSFQRIEWSAFSNFGFGLLLLAYSLSQLNYVPGAAAIVLYPIYIVCGVAIMYSVMICLAGTSIWMGRNQSLYDFWFYITNFSRYPMEIYNGTWGNPLRWLLTFLVPVLVAINVPARFMAMQLDREKWYLAGFAIFATVAALWLTRRIFILALRSYRSASS